MRGVPDFRSGETTQQTGKYLLHGNRYGQDS